MPRILSRQDLLLRKKSPWYKLSATLSSSRSDFPFVTKDHPSTDRFAQAREEFGRVDDENTPPGRDTAVTDLSDDWGYYVDFASPCSDERKTSFDPIRR